MLALILAGALAGAQEPPGALELFPPTARGRFELPVDHFTFADPVLTFSLRYLVYDAFARNASSPVLLYCGNEGAIEDFYNATGAMFEAAADIGARVVFVEHRFYGGSLPFGRASLARDGLMRHLTVEQALADYASFIDALPSLVGCAGRAARARCDVVLYGGSYGGMLAAWHRLKYPHLSLGAVASGAPVDFYPREGMQRRFREAYQRTFARYGDDARCADALRGALDALRDADARALEEAGVRACDADRPPERAAVLSYFEGALSSIAMVDYPCAVVCLRRRVLPRRADRRFRHDMSRAQTRRASSRLSRRTRCSPRARASRGRATTRRLCSRCSTASCRCT